MATLATGVVNAGFPTSGATVQVKRGTISYFAIVKNISPIVDNSTLRAIIPQTNFTANTARASTQYNNSFTFAALIGAIKYQSMVKDVSYKTEIPEVITVDVKTNPYYLTNVRPVSSSINESEIGTTKFYHQIAPHTFTMGLEEIVVDPKTNLTANSINSLTITSSNEEPLLVMDNSTFDLSKGTRNGIVQLSVNEEQILTTPFFHKIVNNPIGNSFPVSVMTVSTFNQSLGTRSGITITSSNEELVSVMNVNNSVTNLNSPSVSIRVENPQVVVDQSTSSGKFNSSALQPKGTEAGNIGFAQAFGNTTIVGKWF